MTRTIKGLRILPPFAIARLGSADEPMDNYTIELDAPANQDRPLGYRALKPLPTLIVGERSGEIEAVRIPTLPLQFKIGDKIRPVAPFLEVFAIVENDKKEDGLVPLTVDLLDHNDLSVKDVSWTITVANRKVARRTGDKNDVVTTDREVNKKTGQPVGRNDVRAEDKVVQKVVVADHDIKTLHGYCNNFESAHENFIVFGQVRFIKPNAKHSEIRLRFTPARGLIYGPMSKPGRRPSDSEASNYGLPLYAIPANQDIYDPEKGIWAGYQDVSEHPEPCDKDDAKLKDWKPRRNRIWDDNNWSRDFDNETLPPGLFAINAPVPSWLYDNVAISRGYLDDACDGFVEVRIARPGEDPDQNTLRATARICSGPPAMAPDSLFVRSLADDLDQVLFGPEVRKEESTEEEPAEITRARAQDIVRRAFETVRFMNVAVMNGNAFKGRLPLTLDSMPEEEAADTERPLRPVMSPGTVDTSAITALHQAAYAALRGGAAPWFAPILRRPDEVADFTDHGRRKMPALMCGADNSYLALTWRQIDTIERVAAGPPLKPVKPAEKPALTPRNLAAQVHYEAMGNPISSRPVTAVANCCPGLEVDFRAVWRRLFKGLELREYDNLVVRVDADDCDPDTRTKVADFAGRRLLRIVTDDGGVYPTTTPIKGTASSDLLGYIQLTTEENPEGLAPLEWSNALSGLHRYAGKRVQCDFTRKPAWDAQAALVEADGDEAANYESVRLEV